MKVKTEQTLKLSSFIVIVFTALVVQFIGSYHAGSFVIGNYFYALWFLLRIAVPVVMLLILKVPLSQIGLGSPRFDRQTKNIVIFAVVILVAAFIGIYFMRGYFSFYSNAFAGEGGGALARFANFMVFTSSTLVGWEFLHRGFLLMGVRYVLAEREGIKPQTASMIAIAVVWIFEVVFHFIKPELEALGLLLGSPLLSWLALRLRSIWVSFLIHFLVELLFITALIMQ